jgi:hypothetical protein
MASTTELLSNVRLEIQSLRTRIISLSPNDVVATALGVYVVFGCKVTSGDSDEDMIVALEGDVPGDEAMHNPRATMSPQRGFEFPNIASLLDGPFHSVRMTAVVDDAPGAGLARYDIAYVFVGQAGAGFAVATGTPSEEVKADFDLNGLDATPYASSSNAFDPALPIGACPVARIYVEGGVTGIPDARIADIRPTVPGVGFEQMSSMLDQAEAAAVAASGDAEQVALDKVAVVEARDETLPAASAAEASRIAAEEAAAVVEVSADKIEPLVANISRRLLPRFLWSPRDIQMKVPLAVERDGKVYVRTFTDETLEELGIPVMQTKTEPLIPDGFSLRKIPWNWRLQDKSHRVAAGLDGLGRLYARTLRLGVQSPVLRTSVSRYISLFSDLTGRMMIGFDRLGGLYVRKFTKETLDYLRGEVGGSDWVDPTTWGPSVDVSDCSRRENTETALLREEWETSRVLRFDGGLHRDGVLQSKLLLEIFSWQGQSNSLDSGLEGQYLRHAWPSHCMGLVSGWRRPPPINDVFDQSDEEDLSVLQLRDTNVAALPVSCAFAHEGQRRMNGEISGGTITWCSGEGSQPLTSFLPPSDPDANPAKNHYENLMRASAAAVVAAGKYGRVAALTYHTYVGNEGGYAVPTGEALGVWAAGFEDSYLPSVVTDLRAATGQGFDPRVLFWQINATQVETAPKNAQYDQLAVGKSQDALGVSQQAWLVGPMYQSPVAPNAEGQPAPSDGIHGSDVGRQFLAETWAYVKRVLDSGRQWTPVWPVSATRSGAVITCEFNDDTYGAGGLVFDDGSSAEYERWMPDTPNNGFSVLVDGSPVAISTVEIAGPNTVVVTLAIDPGASVVRLRYGAAAAENVLLGWSSGRGNLFRPTAQKTWFRREFDLGRFVVEPNPNAEDERTKPPAEVRHYACIFDNLVTEEV